MQLSTRFFVFFAFLFVFSACGETTSEAPTSTPEETPEATTVNQETEPAMAKFVHSVFFYLKEDLTEEQRADFVEGVKSLGDIDEVESFELGKPAGTPRDVVDSSYDYNLILRFANPANQDAYQVHSIHTAFVEGQADKWTRVQVYDTILE